MNHVGRTAVALVFCLAVLPFGGCAPKNTPPEIVSLESRARIVAPSDSVLIECVAFDADGDELTYDWTSDRGTIDGYAGVIAWTAPAEEGLARVTVSVTDGGDEGASESVTVVIKTNHAPVIRSVAAESAWIRPGESVLVHCDAEDSDGDALSYLWSAECGEITGTGDTVSWKAPESEGECVITVVVDDGYERQRTASTTLATAQFEPLLVTTMTVTAVDDPPYLVQRNDWYKVFFEDTYIIECFFTEPDRIVSYEWSDGELSATFPVGAERFVFEDGPSKIRWTAPHERGEYTMTVTVRDAAGTEASKSITLFVENCTCGFPNG